MNKFKEHNLDLNDFDLDEIVSIELIGDEETVDITVEDTHMFFANDIYTHNSSIKAEVVYGDQMGGSIKKAQIGHFILSVAKTLEQKENNTATIAILKSRFGKSGIVIEDIVFNNATIQIDMQKTTRTVTQVEKTVEQVLEGQSIIANHLEKLKRERNDRFGGDNNPENN